MSGPADPSLLRRLELGDFPPALAAALAPRVERLGYLGEFFKCAAHQPRALTAFIEFTEAAKDDLPFELVEVVALTCAAWMGNAYEQYQHERLCLARQCSRDWVRRVLDLAPEAGGALTAEQALLQRFVLVALETRGHGAGPLFETLVSTLGEKQAVAALMVIGRYVVHALIVNTLGLQPPVESIFEGSPA